MNGVSVDVNALKKGEVKYVIIFTIQLKISLQKSLESPGVAIGPT